MLQPISGAFLCHCVISDHACVDSHCACVCVHVHVRVCKRVCICVCVSLQTCQALYSLFFSTGSVKTGLKVFVALPVRQWRTTNNMIIKHSAINRPPKAMATAVGKKKKENVCGPISVHIVTLFFWCVKCTCFACTLGHHLQ